MIVIKIEILFVFFEGVNNVYKGFLNVYYTLNKR